MLSADVLVEKLLPFLMALTPDDVRQMPKMGPRTIDFVSKALDYAGRNAALRPVFDRTKRFVRATRREAVARHP